MREELIRFGAENSTIGIVTKGVGKLEPKLACLLPNIGLAHRIGPHRLNVKVARQLAECGIDSVRFDLSGVGDSPNVKNSGDVIEQVVTDMRHAMDYMERQYDIHRFIVFGICSGAQNGYFLSIHDERVVGLLMYDGFDFPSLRSKLAHQAFQVRSTPLPQLPKRLLNRLLRGSSSRGSDIFVEALNEMHPSREEFRDQMKKLQERGVKIFAFYSGSRRASDSHRGLLAGIRNKAVLDQITYRFEGDMDHTATSSASQRRLLSIVSDWAREVARQ
jgi:pimeloyl-ACP methyl ester carboxylesterase